MADPARHFRRGQPSSCLPSPPLFPLCSPPLPFFFFFFLPSLFLPSLFYCSYPPQIQLRVWGSAVSSPSGIQGTALAIKAFWRFLARKHVWWQWVWFFVCRPKCPCEQVSFDLLAANNNLSNWTFHPISTFQPVPKYPIHYFLFCLHWFGL